MKASRKSVLALIGAMAMGAAVAAPSVEITSVQQQYPWTNTVDIVYTVAGVVGDEGYFVKFTPTTSDNQQILDVNNQPSIEVALTNSGTYTTQWYPQTNQQYTACKMTPAVYRGSARDYMIVDLETGDVTYEPMATQAASNERYQADAYKTRYLVLRRVAADNYLVGDDVPLTTAEARDKSNYGTVNVGDNSLHTVNIPRDYYVAIYLTTEAQWERVVNKTKTSTSTLAKSYVSWNQIRGSALPAATPTSGFMGNLDALTKMSGFDLPTEAMCEIATRAGSRTAYASGTSLADINAYAWHSSHGGRTAQKVGLLLPNNWGLYDTCGNVWEYMRDTWNKADLKAQEADGNGMKVRTAGSTDSNHVPIKNVGNGHSPDYWFRVSARWGGWTKTSATNESGFRVYFAEGY